MELDDSTREALENAVSGLDDALDGLESDVYDDVETALALNVTRVIESFLDEIDGEGQ